MIEIINMKNNLLKNLLAATFIISSVWTSGAWAQDSKPWWTQEIKSKLPRCKGTDISKWNNCFGVHETKSRVYQGEWKNGNWSGTGAETRACKNYIGEYKDGAKHGRGILTYRGVVEEGVWENDKFIREEKTKFPKIELSKKSINDYKKNEPFEINPNKLPLCPAPDTSKVLIFGNNAQTEKWNNCWGNISFLVGDNKFVVEGKWKNGDIDGIATSTFNGELSYVGEWKNGNQHGKGISFFDDWKFIGEYKNSLPNGKGVKFSNGCEDEGIFENAFPKYMLKNLPVVYKDANIHQRNIELAKQAKRYDEDLKRARQDNGGLNKIFNLQITNSRPDANGVFLISIETNSDVASLKINEQEIGGRADGSYRVKKVARAGQETLFTIVATDINGNTDSKTITVSRPITESLAKFATLNPAQLKKQPERDAVAIIIGIAEYKNLPRADFANDDASVFYDYAIRALGIKPENIKLLLDAGAEEVEIFKAFKTWLPSRVKSSTDVYVFYSGHGLPTSDGLGLYLLPYRADRDLISKTAIQFQEISNDIQATKPNSVTIFMDACYSGQARDGETLIASARPLALKSQTAIFPSDFNIFSASKSDQISSSSPNLKHGIFSYYLMRGMEGEADVNKDGKITTGEMQGYLVENVAKQASLANRVQQPQLAGDVNRVLVGK